MSDAERVRRAAVCRDALEAMLAGELGPAAAQLQRLVDASPDAPYRTEAAFLLVLARARPERIDQLRESADALRIVAGGDHPIYTPAAKLLLAGHAARSNDHETATALWRDLAGPYRRGYSPVAFFHLALGHERAGEMERAREVMAQTRATRDPQYAPMAFSWLITYYTERGNTERVSALAEIAFDVPDDPVRYHRGATIEHHLVVGRHMLIHVADPAHALAGAQLLAQADGIDTDPLPVALANDLQSQPTPMAGVDLPWFEPYLRNQAGTASLSMVAHQALAYADYACTQAAIQYLERNNGPANVFANIVHYGNQFPWGAVMHASIRQRMLHVLQAPEETIPTDWASARRP